MEDDVKNTFQAHCTMFLALAATGLFIEADLAVAQQASEEIEEIAIRAPIERHEVRHESVTPLKTEIIELKQRVSFAGLDLTKHADVNELDTRIEAVAKESCEKLSDMFPLNRSGLAEMRRCTKNAIASAENQKGLAIAAVH